MKIPFPLFDAMAPALFDVFIHGRPVDRVVENNFKNHRQWGSRDRRLFAEVIFDVTRFVRRFAKQAGFNFDPSLGSARLELEDFKSILAVYFAEKWPEIKTPFQPPMTKKTQEMSESERLSYSDWLYELGQNELGQDWSAVAEKLNSVPDVYLRTNNLVTDRMSLLKKLADLNVQAEILSTSEVALRLLERKNLFQSEVFKQGWFEVQDISSQRVAELLDPKPGERIVDACAGAGGKSLHLASLMQNQGRVLSMDIHSRKLDELKIRARRNKISIIETREITSTKVIKRLEGSADAVLLDVPCSGSGVIGRNPDTKYRLNQESFDQLLKTQEEILRVYSRMVKPGGRLVYATCSLFPSENEKQITAWLKNNPKWKIEKQKTLIPGRDEGDGFFMAKFSRL